MLVSASSYLLRFFIRPCQWIWRRFYANDRANHSLNGGEILLESGKDPKPDLSAIKGARRCLPACRHSEAHLHPRYRPGQLKTLRHPFDKHSQSIAHMPVRRIHDIERVRSRPPILKDRHEVTQSNMRPRRVQECVDDPESSESGRE